ncbi:uncharacterized protein MONOS_12130 [Monocercomonoides exilis]|uniref:uncharacterized protein n=1 Tax=Monocercomonoides exilis TaxID=2049356 RepID=UPI00355A520A|nr:hypothetical protein MONOS_12130 [Monocercomonoides exilis]|eukprot:MONOS_12130.1-p1 / transcript=MONOS_12130.1 / gene=MONOS_12130 / organism=Monocercomonoides_exilis_PA203 / gene_product=unspecified product / transcript_product=unspecified product / location=Mono_scaffold00649:24632-28729(-) / protein_length=1366 / sequence_SO=supercontig / SO=protein_coding / is_pseudo=false
MILILILANYLFAHCPARKIDNKNRSNAFTDGWADAAVDTVFISEKGDDSKPNCGSEADPCKTIEKGIELLGEGPGDKSIKIVDFTEIPYGFQFSKDFSLAMAAASEQGTRGTFNFDFEDLAVKGMFHMVNEKKLALKHLTFNLIPFKTKHSPIGAEVASAMILSRCLEGDLTIMNCDIYFQKWINEYAPFSILRVTEGKLSIDGFYWGYLDYYYLSNVAILHISEDVAVQKLKSLQMDHAKLEKECALELQSSFTLEGSRFNSVERANAGAALLEAKSGADRKVMITISECEISSIQSLKSENGGSIYFEMMHPESELNIADTIFDWGSAVRGGGAMIGSMKGKVKLENVVFRRCEAVDDGGGLLIMDLTQMAGFDCRNGTFRECKAKTGGGMAIHLGEEARLIDNILFKNCFFKENSAEQCGTDLAICSEGDVEMKKSPFDEDSFSTIKENRVGAVKKDGTIVFHDDWLRFDTAEVDVDGINGEDSVECGRSGKGACKTIKQALLNCLPGRTFTVYTTEDRNKYDTDPITIEETIATVTNRNDNIISITTVLDESKTQPGEGLFNVRKNAYLRLYRADVQVDTTRQSGRGNGLFVCDGNEASANVYRVNISCTDSKQMLNCVLIECKMGTLSLSEVIISNLKSSFAVILVETAKDVDLSGLNMDTISTTNTTQSIITILAECRQLSFSDGNISNCWSTEHKVGGALYLEIGSFNNYSFYGAEFNNCSCKSPQTASNEQNSIPNEESKGGALFIRVSDEITDTVDLILNRMRFSDCCADRGELMYLSFPIGRKQIKDDLFEFEMKEIYGKANLMLLEERKGGEVNIVDLLSDEANRLPYHSQNIYVGGERACNDKICGKKERPCDLISTAMEHRIQYDNLKIHVIGRVLVGKPLVVREYISLTSATESTFNCEHGFGTASNSFSVTEKNRGIIRIESNMKADESIAVFESSNYYISFEHINIEYPNAIEGDVLDVIHSNFKLKLTDVVFSPWYTGLKGENVKGGEGRALPYRLIVFKQGFETFSQLVIYGRNGNITSGRQHNECIHAKEGEEENSLLKLEEPIAISDQKNEIGEEESLLCSWDSGLLCIYESFPLTINDSLFVDISDGAIFSKFSRLILNNCSFVNNHPIGKNWEKFPSIRHNIRSPDKPDSYYIIVNDLATGSDGLDGKPFGTLAEGKVYGHAAENMDSYFFTPTLKNATMIKKSKGEAEKRKVRIIESEEGAQAVIFGSYLFPCELTVEASKKRVGKMKEWIECPVSEYVTETEIRVEIPASLLDGDEYTSLVCRLRYPSGILEGEKKSTEYITLTKQKKEDPKKLTKGQLVAIIVPVSVCSITAVATVVIIAFVVRNKKRKQYKSIIEEKI